MSGWDVVDDVEDPGFEPVPATDHAVLFDDYQEHRERRADVDMRDDAFHYGECPGCGRHVGALLFDGPDPVFADVRCPQCGHVWAVTVQ